MKLPSLPLLQALVLVFFFSVAYSSPKVGFFLPDSVAEMTIRFRTFKDLIILPVRINDSVYANLILDTGCRNLVLFGKRFQKLFRIDQRKEVLFSGLGEGKPVRGNLSIDNTVQLASITGNRVSVIVVPDKNLFTMSNDIHGIIGYDIFLKFEIEINSREKTITFRPAADIVNHEGFSKIPLNIVDSKPVMKSRLQWSPKQDLPVDLMIDTGSSLGILLKTTDIKKYSFNSNPSVLGQGLNGLLKGFETMVRKMDLNGFEMRSLPVGIVESTWENHASIGMDILKDYIVVLNYCQSYACFKAYG